MGVQLLFCVETDKQCNSDWIYIKSFLDEYYEYDRAEIKLEKAYMGGKGNYNTAKFKRIVNGIIDNYRKKAKGETKVIYCFDCDEYDKDHRDADRLQQEKQFCETNGFEFVWFCKDIESVFVGDKIPDDEKKAAAINFLRKGMVSKLDTTKFEGNEYIHYMSNLAVVLDRHLSRKE